MKVQIRSRTQASTRLKFTPGLPGPKGDPGDVTPEFIELAEQVHEDAEAASASASSASEAYANAAAYAAAASGSAGTAALAADAASNAADAASSAASNASAAWNAFRGSFYGALTENPSADPLGNPPDVGDFYFNTSLGVLRLFNGTSWVTAAMDSDGALIAADNLADLPDPEAARDNLGLAPWRELAAYTASSSVAEIRVEIPSDVSLIRGSMLWVPGATDQQPLMRVSTDGGDSFISTSNYSNRQILADSTTITPSGTSSATAFTLAAAGDVTFPELLTFEITRALGLFFFKSHSAVQSTAGMRTSLHYGGHGIGTYNMFVIFPSSGTFAAGTKLIVEGC